MSISKRNIDEIEIWAISHSIFIYKPLVGDENSECYHFVDLSN